MGNSSKLETEYQCSISSSSWRPYEPWAIGPTHNTLFTNICVGPHYTLDGPIFAQDRVKLEIFQYKKGVAESFWDFIALTLIVRVVELPFQSAQNRSQGDNSSSLGPPMRIRDPHFGVRIVNGSSGHNRGQVTNAIL